MTRASTLPVINPSARRSAARRVRRRLDFGQTPGAVAAACARPGVLVIRSRESLTVKPGASSDRLTMFTTRVRQHRYFGAICAGTRVVVIGSGKLLRGQLLCVGVLASAPYRTTIRSKARAAGASPYCAERDRRPAFAFELAVLHRPTDARRFSVKAELPATWRQVRYLQTPLLVESAALRRIGKEATRALLSK